MTGNPQKRREKLKNKTVKLQKKNAEKTWNNTVKFQLSQEKLKEKIRKGTKKSGIFQMKSQKSKISGNFRNIL